MRDAQSAGLVCVCLCVCVSEHDAKKFQEEMIAQPK